ncbi:hypothetical protein ACWOBH_10740 [Globicatella sanguinis]
MKHLELTVEEIALKLAQALVDKNNILVQAQELQQENEQLKARIKELEEEWEEQLEKEEQKERMKEWEELQDETI